MGANSFRESLQLVLGLFLYFFFFITRISFSLFGHVLPIIWTTVVPSFSPQGFFFYQAVRDVHAGHLVNGLHIPLTANSSTDRLCFNPSEDPATWDSSFLAPAVVYTRFDVQEPRNLL